MIGSYLFPRSLLIVAILLLIVTPATIASECNDVSITDIYSDLTSCDVTVDFTGDINEIELNIDLLFEDEVIDSQNLLVKSISGSEDTAVFYWDTNSKKDGLYHVNVEVIENNEVLCTQPYSFVHGNQVLPIVTISSLIPNSEGLSLVITPQKSTIANIEYMLVKDARVIDISTDEKVSIHTQPSTLSNQWETILEDGEEYRGRAKVHIFDPYEVVIVEDKEFTAKSNVEITDTYKDEIGASVTVNGISQVPFEGEVTFTVYEAGQTIDQVTTEVPLLLTGDDETIEAIWEQNLAKGEYTLSIEVISSNGEIIERKDTVIDVTKDSTINGNDTVPDQTEETPGFIAVGVVSTFLILACAVHRK